MVQVANYLINTHPQRTVIDELGNVFHVEFRGSLTTVTLTTPLGIRARGHALHNPTDVYNKEFGEHLAIVRASQRALRKYEKWLSREGFRTANLGEL